MENKFFNNFLEKSKILRERFVITTKNEWNPMSVLTELYVQIGHVYTVLKNSSYLEENRKIDDLGDEVSDVVFQLIIIGNMYNFDYENYKDKSIKDANMEDLIVVIGQLSEAVMEDCGHRFEKPRQGFETTLDFIKFKISQGFDIIFEISNSLGLQLEKEYQKMIDSANNWLDKNY
jgi:hypothetical protein